MKLIFSQLRGVLGDFKAIFQVILGLEGKKNGREGEEISS